MDLENNGRSIIRIPSEGSCFIIKGIYLEVTKSHDFNFKAVSKIKVNKTELKVGNRFTWMETRFKITSVKIRKEKLYLKIDTIL